MFTELAVFFNLPGLLRQVRPLPSNYLHFPGKFKMCRNNPCKRDYSCTFAHDELELQAWNKRKKDILDSMHMYVCTYVCMYVCMYVCVCLLCKGVALTDMLCTPICVLDQNLDQTFCCIDLTIADNYFS